MTEERSALPRTLAEIFIFFGAPDRDAIFTMTENPVIGNDTIVPGIQTVIGRLSL
jgi:hypothetical protein